MKLVPLALLTEKTIVSLVKVITTSMNNNVSTHVMMDITELITNVTNVMSTVQHVPVQTVLTVFLVKANCT
jgi:hypothetical protein